MGEKIFDIFISSFRIQLQKQTSQEEKKLFVLVSLNERVCVYATRPMLKTLPSPSHPPLHALFNVSYLSPSFFGILYSCVVLIDVVVVVFIHLPLSFFVASEIKKKSESDFQTVCCLCCCYHLSYSCFRCCQHFSHI